MQRPVVASSTRENGGHVIINMPPDSPQRRTDDQETGGFKDFEVMEEGYIYDGDSSNIRHHHHHRRRVKSRYRMTAEKWIHVIPLIVILCVFILWWFSYPVSLEIKDGRVTRVHDRRHELTLDEKNHIDLTFLSVATSPRVNPLFSDQKSSAISNDDTSSVSETYGGLTFLATTTSSPSPYASIVRKLSDEDQSEAASSPSSQ